MNKWTKHKANSNNTANKIPFRLSKTILQSLYMPHINWFKRVTDIYNFVYMLKQWNNADSQNTKTHTPKNRAVFV